jgi:hypothetical protein
MACEKYLTSNIESGCSANNAGYERKGYIINRSDIDLEKVAYDVDFSNLVTSLPLLSNKFVFKLIVPPRTPFSGTKTEFNQGTYINTFNHTVAFVLLNSGPDASKIADILANGEFVILLESKTPDSKAHWEVYGLRQGLQMSSATREPWNDDTRTGWSVEMQENGSSSAGDWATDDVITALTA